jgi:hypothetical protein
MDLNTPNPQLASFKTRIHLSLSFISGAQVRQWKERMRVWVRNPMVDDNEATWDQFIDLFKAQYADTQKGERARTNIENIAMKNMDVDQYIADFIDLATEADYHLDAEGTKRAFNRGLPRFIGTEATRRLPRHYTWAELIAATIEAVNWAKNITNVWGPPRTQQTQNRNWRRPNTGNPLSFQTTPRPTAQTPTKPINSTNAPPWMNNTPVPMDTSRAQGRRWTRTRNGGANVTQTNRPPREKPKCFRCGSEEHLIRVCPQPKQGRAMEMNAYDLMTDPGDQTLVDWSSPPPTDAVANVMQLLRTMTDDDRARMQQQMGGGEEQDFHSV